jgi:iron complex transport system substrate-binding protein
VLIYNSTVAGEVTDMDSFLSQYPLLGDIKAVKEGDVWCTEMSMFQRSSAAADMIREFRAAVSGDTGENLRYLHRIQ